MKRQRGFAGVMELVVIVLWIVGFTYITRELEHCPEPDGKIARKLPNGEVVCK